MPPTFIFLRHGEAQHNVAYKEHGASVFKDEAYRDPPLTSKGEGQASAVGKSLFSYPILDIWCSPLTRCIQTAENIFEEINVNNIYFHDALLELQVGGYTVCQRKPKAELKEKYGCWTLDFLADIPAVWTSVEPLSILRARMMMFLSYLAHFYRDKPETSHVLIISHQYAIHSLTGVSLKTAEFVKRTWQELQEGKIDAKVPSEE